MEDVKEYLGDGVYADWAPNGCIKLSINYGDGAVDVIYLEKEVYESLKRYAKKIGWEEEENAREN